jgi:hypothetical protein
MYSGFFIHFSMISCQTPTQYFVVLNMQDSLVCRMKRSFNMWAYANSRLASSYISAVFIPFMIPLACIIWSRQKNVNRGILHLSGTIFLCFSKTWFHRPHRYTETPGVVYILNQLHITGRRLDRSALFAREYSVKVKSHSKLSIWWQRVIAWTIQLYSQRYNNARLTTKELISIEVTFWRLCTGLSCIIIERCSWLFTTKLYLHAFITISI